MDVVARSVLVIGSDLTTEIVFDGLKEGFGDATVSSVVLGVGGVYVTFGTVRDAIEFSNMYLEKAGWVYHVERVAEQSVVASIFDVPEFVTDGAIAEKFQNIGCVVKGDFLWQRAEGVYFGERRVRVVLPKGVSSLPSRLKVPDVLGRELVFRVSHASQRKVCNNCLAPNHLYSDCPGLVCRRCSGSGHLARVCQNMIVGKGVILSLVVSPTDSSSVAVVDDVNMQSVASMKSPNSSPPATSPSTKRSHDSENEVNIDLLIDKESWNEGDRTIFDQLHRHLQRKLTTEERVLTQRVRKKLETAGISEFFAGR